LAEIKYTEQTHTLSCVIVLGDFNEPSHRDWTTNAVDAKIHPIKVEFPSVKTFESSGFIDSFRDRHPDPVRTPGFTWPTPNRYSKSEIVEDRIDYILVKGSYLKVLDASIIGEKEFKPWPSDHRSCICVLSLGNNYYKKYLLSNKKR
jgi:exonuclease III